MSMLASVRLCCTLIAVFAAIGLSGCAGNDPVARGKVDVFDGSVEITLIGVNRKRAAEITTIIGDDLRIMERAWHAWNDGPLARVNLKFNASD